MTGFHTIKNKTTILKIETNELCIPNYNSNHILLLLHAPLSTILVWKFMLEGKRVVLSPKRWAFP